MSLYDFPALSLRRANPLTGSYDAPTGSSVSNGGGKLNLFLLGDGYCCRSDGYVLSVNGDSRVMDRSERFVLETFSARDDMGDYKEIRGF